MKRRGSSIQVEESTPIFGAEDEAHVGLGNDVVDPFAAYRKVAEEFTSFKPATDVFRVVRAIPTIFPDFDRAVQVGGFPIERFALVHGPSGEGKSVFNIGLMKSFLMANHLVAFIDAERTTPAPWLVELMYDRVKKINYFEHPFFRGSHPTTYEATKMAVREFLNKVKSLRTKGELAPDTSALVVIDSIRKLVPEAQWKIILKLQKEISESKAGDTKEIGNRMAQIKALMNSAWMDEIIPLLEQTGTAMVVIARETVDPDVAPRKGFGGKIIKTMKTGGGGALYYDASLDIRIELAGPYGKKGEEEGAAFQRYGERHRVTITKSKVAGKGSDYRTECFFHVSMGGLTPAGFDSARDILDVARRMGVVDGTGWLRYGSWRRQGEDAAVLDLMKKPDLLREIDAETRALFKTVNA